MAIAQSLRDGKYPSAPAAPNAIVPSGDGGIFFEWGRPGQVFGSLEIKNDGTAIYTLSRHCKIVLREQVL